MSEHVTPPSEREWTPEKQEIFHLRKDLEAARNGRNAALGSVRMLTAQVTELQEDIERLKANPVAKAVHYQLDEARNLNVRWNKAASEICPGSEFIDDPDRVFGFIKRRLDSLWGTAKGWRADRSKQLTELRAANAALRGQVEPFAEMAKNLVAVYGNAADDWEVEASAFMRDWRALAAALEGKDEVR